MVGAIYQTTLNVDEGDEREALQYIHDCAGMILDENEPSPDSLLQTMSPPGFARTRKDMPE